jgi:hypothetical protein
MEKGKDYDKNFSVSRHKDFSSIPDICDLTGIPRRQETFTT